jgi:Ca2+:H+ antiporter
VAQGFHKRQEFSVDDDPAEVEAERQQLASLASATGRGSLRKQPSTLRRRATGQMLSTLARVDSAAEEGDGSEPPPNLLASTSEVGEPTGLDSADEGTIRPGSGGGGGGDVEEVEIDEEDCDDDAVSQAESFTLKDRQNAINETHPFGIRVWKPALYKKNRSVQKSAEGDIHSSPGGRVSNWLFVFNILWTLFFGWWLACAAALGAVFCLLLGWTSGGIEYGRVLGGLAAYLLYPFGKFVSLRQDEAYAEEDEGEGRSISEYEQWQSGDLENGRLIFGPHTNTRSVIGRRRNSIESASETDSLLGRTWRRQGRERNGTQSKRRLFGRGEWNLGRVIFFACFYGLVGPLMLLASGFCWLLVFWIPMGKVTMLLDSHLRRHPLALSFHSADLSSREDGPSSSSILLCTYRAVGLKYWKYTIDGTNIFLINLMSVVLFVIFDYWILDVTLHLKIGITHPAVVFFLSLFSVVPLAYFIGQAVASISAQSSMGVGAAINAFFSTIVEVYLYCVALNEGKGKLVEGSIIGSIFAGVLFLPGISMCFGALKRKTQRFNAKSAGVTSTMLLFAVIAAFGPTLFYQIYGTVRLLPAAAFAFFCGGVSFFSSLTVPR